MIQTGYSFSNAVISPLENKLPAIHESSKNIAVWQRDTSSLQALVEQLKNQSIECRATGTKAEILATLHEYVQNDLPQASALYEDISTLLDLFADLTEASSFRLLLTTVNSDMCRKFHTDVNDLRMLCTYTGPGTLWLPDEAILQARGRDLKIDESKIQQVATGDVVVLKGALYPQATPILHRSPAIEEAGATRIVLRIDTNEFLNF